MDIKDIGQLDRRITLRTPTETTDAFGQSVRVYADNGQVWAAVNFAPGDEGEVSDRLEAVKNVSFVIRYNTNFNEKCQIVWDGQTFEIENVLPVERKRWMLIKTRLIF
jgi:SPP1 family predicted phage head-tail adaptor